MQQTFDRAAEDLGNVIHLEHVNVQIPDQRLATLFYCAGLGLTRDPYLMVSDNNMWVNVGCQQFHLPKGDAQTRNESIQKQMKAPKVALEGARVRARDVSPYAVEVLVWGDLPRSKVGKVLKADIRTSLLTDSA